MTAAKFLRICGFKDRDFPPNIGDYRIELDADVVCLQRGSKTVGRFSERGVNPRCVLARIRQDCGQ